MLGISTGLAAAKVVKGGVNAAKSVGRGLASGAFRGNDVKESPFSRFLDFVARYWIVLVGLMLATPYIFKWLSNLKADAGKAEAEAQIKALEAEIEKSKSENVAQDIKVNETKEAEILKSITSQQIRDRLKGAAKNLAYALGTAADSNWWDITTYTESDAEARLILKQNWYYISYVEKLYMYVYTKNRNLKSDVNKLLDNSDFKNVQDYYRSQKSYYFG